MDSYKIKVDIEPDDNYQKARKDIVQALESFAQLNPQQKQALFNEMVQYAAFRNFGAYYSNNGIE